MSWGKMGATSLGEGCNDSISVVDHPRALDSPSVDTPFGEGCNELAVPTVSVPTIYLNHVETVERGLSVSVLVD